MSLKKRVLQTGAAVALSGLFAFSTQTDVEASSWQPRTVSEIEAEIDSQLANEDSAEYTFKSGDTLWGISEATDISVNKLAQINDIENSSMIVVGNSIHLSSNKNVVSVEKGDQVESYDVSNDNVEKTETPQEVEQEAVQDNNAEEQASEQNAAEQEAAEQRAAEQAAAEERAAEQEDQDQPEADSQTKTNTNKVAGARTVSTNSSAASQQVPEYVLQVVESEAGPSYQEKLNVFSVIVNRANSGQWGGSDYMSVVTAPGQFQVTWNGMAANAQVSNQTRQAVNDVLANGVTTGAESFRASGDGVTNVFF